MAIDYAKKLELETLLSQINGMLAMCVHFVPSGYSTDDELANALWGVQDMVKRAEEVLADICRDDYEQRTDSREWSFDDEDELAFSDGEGEEIVISLSSEDGEAEEEAGEDGDDGADRFHAAVVILINAQEEE